MYSCMYSEHRVEFRWNSIQIAIIFQIVILIFLAHFVRNIIMITEIFKYHNRADLSFTNLPGGNQIDGLPPAFNDENISR